MSLELSLYQIESDLANLIEMREDVATWIYKEEGPGDTYGITEADVAAKREELAVIDAAIREYLTAEIRKVDGVRSFWRHAELMRDAAKAEARVQNERAAAWDARLVHLKAMCQQVMEMIPFPAGKPKKLEGRTGALYLKANGGKQAVTVTDESLVPDEYMVATVQIRADRWVEIVRSCPELVAGTIPTVEPLLSLIRAALEKGEGVPGAYLAERGVHVECK